MSLLLALALAIAGLGMAQAQPGPPRIGFLDPTPSALAKSRLEQFRAGMQEHGYEEGKHYVLEYRSAEGRFDRLPALAAELSSLPVRVLVTRTTPGTRAAREATGRIPIVIGDVGDPLGLGFVQSMSRPGGNITGTSNATLELIRKRLEILSEVLPGLRRAAVLANGNDPNTPYQLAEAEAAAKALGLEIRVFDARTVPELQAVLNDIAAWRAQAVLPLVHPLRQAMTPALVRWAADRRVPVIYAAREDLAEGGLMAFSADLGDQWRRVARYVDRLLKGAHAADLPVERPTRFVLAINLKAARDIGLTIPASVLARADELIR